MIPVIIMTITPEKKQTKIRFEVPMVNGKWRCGVSVPRAYPKIILGVGPRMPHPKHQKLLDWCNKEHHG